MSDRLFLRRKGIIRAIAHTSWQTSYQPLRAATSKGTYRVQYCKDTFYRIWRERNIVHFTRPPTKSLWSCFGRLINRRAIPRQLGQLLSGETGILGDGGLDDGLVPDLLGLCLLLLELPR